MCIETVACSIAEHSATSWRFFGQCCLINSRYRHSNAWESETWILPSVYISNSNRLRWMPFVSFSPEWCILFEFMSIWTNINKKNWESVYSWNQLKKIKHIKRYHKKSYQIRLSLIYIDRWHLVKRMEKMKLSGKCIESQHAQ